MIAGYFILDINSGESAIDLAERIVVVAVNQKTAKAYTGKMHNIGFRKSPFSNTPPSSGNSFETISSNFNIDLFQNLNIPTQAAIYSVYATLDDQKSNAVQIEVDIK